jgi:CxxC-x17-CxxC domain-containing protein
MPEFKKNPRFGGGAPRSFGKGRPGGSFNNRPSRDFGPKEMHRAECNSCHKECEVPFRPNGKKPVYCADCFSKEGGEQRFERPRFEKRDFGPSRSFNDRNDRAPRADTSGNMDGVKRQLDAIHATLEKLVSVIESQNRKAELTKEMSKYVTKTEAEPAPKKVAKASKPTAKKPAKAPKKKS